MAGPWISTAGCRCFQAVFLLNHCLSIVFTSVCLQREVAEHIVAALETGGGSMDQLCRLLLAADAFQVVLLRNYCLAGLAQAFRSLATHTKREQAVFEAFVDAVAPKARLCHCVLHVHVWSIVNADVQASKLERAQCSTSPVMCYTQPDWLSYQALISGCLFSTTNA